MRFVGSSGTLSALLVVALGSSGCGVRGAADPCPEDRKLGASLAESCYADHDPILETVRDPGDLTVGGELWGAALPISGRRLRHVVALDYSGSMYGGYQDETPGSPPCGWRRRPDGGKTPNGPYLWEAPELVELLADGPLGALDDRTEVFPMVFNEAAVLLGVDGSAHPFDAVASHFSDRPAPHFGRDDVLQRLTSGPTGELPASPWGAVFGNPAATRLAQVLDAASALFESFEERDGILYILTDNIIEQTAKENLISDASYNREFYVALKSNPRWQVVHAWPIHRGTWLCGSTLMVYGLYYSSRERLDAKAYDQLSRGSSAQLDHPRQQQAFARYADSRSPKPGSPFKLKPVDLDIVRISFEGSVECREVSIGEVGECKAKLRIQNLLNHRQVESAQIELFSGRCDPKGVGDGQLVDVQTARPFCEGEIVAAKTISTPIPPDQERTFEITLHTPPVVTERHTLGDVWENAGFANFLMIGGMRVKIRELETTLVIGAESLGDVYGVEALPELFRNPIVDNLRTSICVVLPVRNPTQLASVLLLVLVLVLAGVVTAGSWLARPLYRSLEVDGILGEERIRLVRYRWSAVSVEGRQVGEGRLRWASGEPLLRGTGKYSIQRRGSSWTLRQQGGDVELEQTLRLRQRGASTQRLPRRNDGF